MKSCVITGAVVSPFFLYLLLLCKFFLASKNRSRSDMDEHRVCTIQSIFGAAICTLEIRLQEKSLIFY